MNSNGVGISISSNSSSNIDDRLSINFNSITHFRLFSSPSRRKLLWNGTNPGVCERERNRKEGEEKMQFPFQLSNLQI